MRRVKRGRRKEKIERVDKLLIRSVDASLIYNMSEHEDSSGNIKLIQSLKQEYTSILNKISELDKDAEGYEEKKKELTNELALIESRLQDVKGMNCKLTNKDSKYYYHGVLDDSLMLRELLTYANSNDVRKVSDGDDNHKNFYYSIIVINLTFKDDIMLKTKEKKFKYNNDKDELVDNGYKYKTLITSSELREKFYTEGFTLNGNKYINFQRSSAKSRTGNNLFIQERLHGKELAQEMIEWQRLGIRFNGLTDVVSVRAYESLTSSSIINAIEINPNNILLIDDVTGRTREKCNVVEMGTYQTAYTREIGRAHV